MKTNALLRLALMFISMWTIVGCGSDLSEGVISPGPSHPSVSMEKPALVTIAVESIFAPDATTSGTFLSTGALNSSGVTSESIHFGDEHTWHSRIVFADANGTFTLENQGQYFGTGPTTVAGDGNWGVLTGTGAYSKLHGTGTLSMTVAFGADGFGDLKEMWEGHLFFDKRP